MILDTNAAVGHWPLRPTRATDADGLEALLRAEGIDRACAYAAEAWLWPDPQEANVRCLPALAEREFFIPSAVLNPTLPLALDHYEVCRGEWNVPLVRLMPGWHLYELGHEGVEALAARAEADGVALGIYLRGEDPRGRNPLLIEPPEVPFGELLALAQRHPGLNVIAFCLARAGEVGSAGVLPEGAMAKLFDTAAPEAMADLPDNLFIELSFWEHNDSFTAALQLFRPEQVLFGTHAPMHIARTAVDKIRCSDAAESAKAAALGGNAARLLGLGVPVEQR